MLVQDFLHNSAQRLPDKVALICGRQRLTYSKILAYCRSHLEDFMVPKYVEIRGELPKTTSNKIKKTELK